MVWYVPLPCCLKRLASGEGCDVKRTTCTLLCTAAVLRVQACVGSYDHPGRAPCPCNLSMAAVQYLDHVPMYLDTVSTHRYVPGQTSS